MPSKPPSPRAWPFNPQPGPRPPSPEQDPGPPRDVRGPRIDSDLPLITLALLALALLALALVLVLSACTPGPAAIRPDCGAPCCVSSLDPGADDLALVPCDGVVADDPDLGAACARPSGVVEACARD